LVGGVGGVVSLGSVASVVTVTALLGGDQLMPLSRALTVKDIRRGRIEIQNGSGRIAARENGCAVAHKDLIPNERPVVG